MRVEDPQHLLPGDMLEVKLKRGNVFTVFNSRDHLCDLHDGMGMIVTHVMCDGMSNPEVHALVMLKHSVDRVWFYCGERSLSYVTVLGRAA